jgi:hypothetical protein
MSLRQSTIKQKPVNAILNGVLCKRKPPETWDGSRFVIPEKYRKRGELNNWVEVFSVGPHCKEDIKAGDLVFIGNAMGEKFIHPHTGEDCVLVYDKEPLLRMRNA